VTGTASADRVAGGGGGVRADVWLGVSEAAPADITGRVVAVIDVLRSSTTIAAALAHGARAIIPCASAEEVGARAKALTGADVLLAGERRMRPVPGFDLGNSPSEFTHDAVDGKTILLATTNGTPALVGVQAGGATDIVVASFTNFSAILALLRAALRGGTDIAILCAGHERRFALEDVVCAGLFMREIGAAFPAVVMNDGAVASATLERSYRAGGSGTPLTAIRASEHGRALDAAGFGRDLVLCGTLDAFPVVPVYQDRQITKLGPERRR
jgi:2-phosphosulfolactate phosphatase